MSPSSAAASRRCGRRTSSSTRGPVARDRRARARDRGVRRVGPERRLVLGAVPEVGRPRSNAARVRRRGRDATRDGRHRRRGRAGHGARGHRLRLRARRHARVRPRRRAASRRRSRCRRGAAFRRRPRSSTGTSRRWPRRRARPARWRPPTAVFDPACARVHPAKLVRGLARVVEARACTIFERTEVLDWSAGRVRFRSIDGGEADGTIVAKHVIVATEGYGPRLPRVRRRILPLYSLMIATEPLSDEVWDEIGIAHGQTFSDYRHLLIYGQRTADNRFAFGGRGANYHWGSAVDPAFERVDAVFEHLHAALRDLFPAVGEVARDASLGRPARRRPRLARDSELQPEDRGRASPAATSVTGSRRRISPDARWPTSCSASTRDLTRLPWANHRSPLWEPEPLRYVGANLGMLGMTVADAEERLTGGRRSSLARWAADGTLARPTRRSPASPRSHERPLGQRATADEAASSVRHRVRRGRSRPPIDERAGRGPRPSDHASQAAMQSGPTARSGARSR